jgi:transcriptional regulator with XRE-family HTH domain
MALDLYQLGRRIAASRELRDLTQQQLADRADLTQATIARIEKGRKPGVHVQTLVAIADVLDVSTDYLLGRDKATDDAPRWEKARRPPARAGA